jgi:hypothetical protein
MNRFMVCCDLLSVELEVNDEPVVPLLPGRSPMARHAMSPSLLSRQATRDAKATLARLRVAVHRFWLRRMG